MSDDVELIVTGDANEVRLTVSPTAGGRIRQILVSGVGLLVEATDDDPLSSGWGAFPMTPWAGRIRNGRFTFAGEDVALDLNHEDSDDAGGTTLHLARPGTPGELPDEDRNRHAIHGTTFTRPWTVESKEQARLELSCDLVGALGWPFPGIARQTISLAPHRVDLAMTVESAGGSIFPASLGWHPWFVKPDRLDFDPVAMYEKDATGLPTGRLVIPPTGPWDDCFVNHRPIRLHYDRALASTVTISSPADHWVIYDGPDHATCVEPQTGPPDAPTLRPEVVAPGAPLASAMTIEWT